MGCYNDAQLQAYLDGAVSFAERKEIEKHLETCDLCKVSLLALKENSDFTSDYLGLWGTEVSQLKVSPKTGWSKFNLSHSHHLASHPDKKKQGGLNLTSPVKKWAIVAAATLCIGLSFTSSTVRAAASDFLTLFRVEKIQTISVDPQQLRDMERVFKEKGSSLKVENFGKVTNNGVESPREISLEEARKLADFDLRVPTYLPVKYSRTLTNYTKAGSVELQLNVQNVNNLIKSLGGTTYLPQELDNKTFYLKTPNAFSILYQSLDDKGKAVHRLSVSQFETPEIIAPAGVNAGQMREAILSLPVIPEDIRRQLASIEDWQRTLVVPTMAGLTKNIDVNGTPAIYTVPKTEENRPDYGILTWKSGGVITIIDGDMSQNELVKVAESLK